MANNNLWRSVSASTDYFSSSGSSASSTEPDMREEFRRTIEGYYPEIAKGQPALLRIMRLDADDKTIACSCVDSITREPDKDRFCPVCMGSGKIWDETEVSLYKTNIDSAGSPAALLDQQTSAGLLNIPLVVFYIKYSEAITKEDCVVLVRLDNAGDMVVPTRRTAIYRINQAWDYRADNGKLEYWKVFAHEESVKYLNAPSFLDLE